MIPERFWGQPARYNMSDHENGYQSSLYQQFPYYYPPQFENIPSYGLPIQFSAQGTDIFPTDHLNICYGCLNCRFHHNHSSNAPSFQDLPIGSLFHTDYSWENSVVSRGNTMYVQRNGIYHQITDTPPVAATAESPGLFPDASDEFSDISGGDFTEYESYEELLSLDEGIEIPRGLDNQKIASLVSFEFNVDRHQGNQTSCVVCMFEFEPSELIRMLPCSHEFHAKCIDKWFQTKTTCPICRKNVSDCKTTSY